MVMKNKLGQYIQKLMTTVIDTEEGEFARELSWYELKRINSDINDFLMKNELDKELTEKEVNEKQKLLFD